MARNMRGGKSKAPREPKGKKFSDLDEATADLERLKAELEAELERQDDEPEVTRRIKRYVVSRTPVENDGQQHD